MLTKKILASGLSLAFIGMLGAAPAGAAPD